MLRGPDGKPINTVNPFKKHTFGDFPVLNAETVRGMKQWAEELIEQANNGILPLYSNVPAIAISPEALIALIKTAYVATLPAEQDDEVTESKE